jgi:zinc protease
MSPERALARVDEELRAIAGGEIRDSELASMIDLQVRQIQQSLGYTPEAETLALLSVRGLGWQDLQDDIGRWRQVSSEDLRRAARALLSGDKRSAVIVEPGEARRDPVSAPRRAAPSRVDDTPTPEEMDLLRSLARLDWSGYTFKKPSEFVLPNGLKVILMPDPRIPTVYAKLAFRLGRTSADSGLRAKVPLVAQLMRMRTAGSDEKAIEDRLSEMQGTLAADQKWDHSVFDGNAPSEQAPDLLGLLAEVASRPEAWTAEKLDSWKAWFKQNLGQDKADAGFASHLRALKDLLGGHPSANATVTPETVDSLTPEEVERIAREHFAPDNAVLVLAGAVDPRAIKAQVESLFGSWKPSGVRQARSPLPEILPQARISLIDRPGSEQTFIRMTALAPQAGSQGSADHFPLVVANQILGTGFASRLFQVVRQGLGLAYEAFSSVATDPALAMWTFGLYTRPEKTSQALDALLLQARLMREEAPDEVELGGAKNAIIGSFLMSLDAIGQIADHLLGLELFGQPLAEWGLYPAKVSAVTSEAVREIAERILDLDKTAVTVVADARAVRGQIEGRRPLDEFDSNGDPKNPPALASLIR